MEVRPSPPWRAPVFVSALTLFALAIAGFHPFVEDGGIYLAGVERLLDPTLFPSWSEFVIEHLRFSLFAPAVAALVRASHLPLGVMVLVLYVMGIWFTLWSAYLLLRRATPNSFAQAGGLSLLACWLTLPIAGTSLMLMDPYLTARTFSTPLTLLALAWTLDALEGRRSAWLGVAAVTGAAFALHPLMAGYGLAGVLVLAVCGAKTRSVRRRGPVVLLVLALLGALALRTAAVPESDAYVRIALTRYYWFPFAWQWYEQFGLLAPMLILVWLSREKDRPRAWQRLALTGVLLALNSLTVAVFFAHQNAANHLVARLQPLRAFQLVYELMILLLGAWLGEFILGRQPWRWALLLASMGGILFFVQRDTFPTSAHLEWPWNQSTNPWEQAFLWARENTPVDALFALDAHYITQGHHEDAQCFRAIAERSALPDYSKDGGEASITPSLTADWSAGEGAQEALESESDDARLQHLKPLHVGWIVLEQASRTRWACPYANATVKVCRLP